MLRTRLWMGAVLILLVLGVLLLDGQFEPYFPFLFVLLLALAVLACRELLGLLGPRRPWPWLCYLAVAGLVTVNWAPHLCPRAHVLSPDPLRWVFGVYVAVVLVAFLTAMASFRPADDPARADTLGQVALLLFAATYLGVLPCFLAQLRWLPGERAVFAVALAVFVPKCCDIGAYFTGRLLGKHKMAPVLSPKKTWEGLAGGLVLGMVAAVALNRTGGGFLSDVAAAGFGVTVGGAGVLGDLAESLIKRDCRQKDASQVVPGFGGVLDVIDSILYAAPVAYCWLA